MVNSELVATLRVFSKKEQRYLELFLQSPYCTNGREAGHELKLVRHIFTALAAGEPGKATLEEAAVYSALHPERPSFSAQTVNNAAVSTLKLVRRFIIMEMTARTWRPTSENTLLLLYFREKGAFDLCKKTQVRLEREGPEENSLDDLDFLQDWQAENAKAAYLVMETELKSDFNLFPSLRALELFYLVERLNILTALFNQHRIAPVFEETEQEALIEEIDRWADKPFFNHPAVTLARKALSVLCKKGEEAEKEFEAFMEMLAQQEMHLSVFFLKRFESIAYNFCARHFDRPEYREKLFWLFHRRLLPERQHSEEGIHCIEFLSMIKTALMGEQYDLAKSFIDTYRYRIKGRETAQKYYQFGLALYYFELKRLDEARSIIVHLNFHDIVYKYIFKTLEIKIFFEAGEDNHEFLRSRLGTLKVAVHRDKTSMPEEKARGYRNFVNIMLRLVHWCSDPDQDKRWLLELIREVEEGKDISEKVWLLKKLRELLARL